MTERQIVDLGRLRELRQRERDRDIERNAILDFVAWLGERGSWPNWSDPNFNPEEFLAWYEAERAGEAR